MRYPARPYSTEALPNKRDDDHDLKNDHVFFFASIAAANAATHHVSNHGDDSHTGADSQPWKTIQHSVDNIQAGDTLIIHGGSYQSENVWISQLNGTASNPIHIRAASGETPVLQSLQFRNHNSWYIVEGLTFKNTRFGFPAAWQDMPTVMIDDPAIAIDPKEDWATREGKIRKKYSTFMALYDTMQNNWSIGIRVENGNHITMRGNHFEGYTAGIQVTHNSAHMLVEENTSYRCAYAFFAYAPSPAIHDSIIRKNDFQQSLRAAISLKEGSSKNIIEGNFTQHYSISGITLNKNNYGNIIRHNISQYGGYYSETMKYPGSTAINIHTSGPGNIVDGNFAAYQIDWTFNDGNGFAADLMHNGASVTFINNIAYRNMGSGLTMTESPNGVIKNNTFIENGYQTTSLRNGAGVRLSRDADIKNVVSGNIFSNNGTSGLYAGHRNLANQTHVDHNLYFSYNGNPFVKDDWGIDNRNYYTLEQIHNNSNAEGNGVSGNPLFVDERQENFHLQAESPAISQADLNLAPSTDKDGNNRDSQPDIGAFEYQGQGSNPSPPSDPQRLSFSPNDDATLIFRKPSANNNSKVLEVDNSARKHILLKFTIAGLNQRQILQATLKLHNLDSSRHGGDLYQAEHNHWNEQTVTWNSSPKRVGNVLDTVKKVRVGKSYTWDVTSLIQADGVYSLRMESPSSNGADYSSKEGAHPPQLVVTVGNGE